jgi:molybdenum cofactor cytidylyltransferase
VIAALLLAAGSSRRFGAPKLLQDLGGKPVIRWSLESLIGPPVDEVLVVVPPEHRQLQRALAGLPVRYVVNFGADSGIGSSIAAGVSALRSNSQAVLVALADEPRMPKIALSHVLERYRQGGASIVVPTYEGVRGHPVLFDRSVFAEVRQLGGDVGARELTERDPSRLAFVEVGSAKPVDVDTPADLEKLRTGAPPSAHPDAR